MDDTEDPDVQPQPRWPDGGVSGIRACMTVVL